ncbi:hypothetical protein M011DRAFT_477620 [Sporormia fimetaria CBS 119925]|uniref:Uncharacterized protein n=1 Tax=Sporormia fimetaria CBS 119925 TaxID=1340428 RepID=A0A6A6VAP6_9PLEO|nr:hypothetical protein M011DRAFT_477620 [Sporormia fimetaria CBS 119925]
MEDTEDIDIAAAMGFSSFGGAKKRKFSQSNSPKRGGPDASGANSVRLGVRTKLTDNEPDPEEIPGKVMESTEQTGKSKANAKLPAASSLADFLNRGQSLPEKPVSGPAPVEEQQPNSKDDTDTAVSFGGPTVTKAELNALRQGIRNSRGDLAYFLPSFVEDPWEKLERGRG